MAIEASRAMNQREKMALVMFIVSFGGFLVKEGPGEIVFGVLTIIFATILVYPKQEE